MFFLKKKKKKKKRKENMYTHEYKKPHLSWYH